MAEPRVDLKVGIDFEDEIEVQIQKKAQQIGAALEVGIQKSVHQLGADFEAALGARAAPAAWQAAGAVAEVGTATDTTREKLRQYGDAVDQSNRHLYEFGRHLLAITGLVGGASAFLRMADDYATLQARLAIASEGLGSTAQAYRLVYDVAQSTRQPVGELVTLYSRFADSAKVLGVSQERLAGVTRTVAEAMAVGGGSTESMRGALIQLGQGIASGVLRGEELNSVLENTPRLSKAIAEGFGTTVGRLREMGQAGELTSNRLIDAIERASGSVERDFAAMPLTVAGGWTQMSNAALNTVGSFDRATGASSTFASVLGALANNMDVVIAGGAALGATGLAAFLSSSSWAAGLLAGSVAALGSPVVLATAGVAALAGGSYVLTNRMREAYENIDVVRAKLAELEGVANQEWRIFRFGSTDGREVARAIAEQKDLIATLELRMQTENEAAGVMRGLPALMRQVAEEERQRTEAMRQAQTVMQKLSGVSDGFRQSLTVLHRAYELGGLNVEDYRSQVEALIMAEGGGKRIVDEFTRAKKDQASTLRDAAKIAAEAERERARAAVESAQLQARAFDEAWAADQREQASTIARIRTAREAFEAIEFETQALGMNSVEREISTRMRELERRGVVAGTEAYDAFASKIREAVVDKAAVQQNIDSMRQMVAESAKAAEAGSKAWRQAGEQIEQSLTDSLVRGFDSGKPFVDNLIDYVRNGFKSLSVNLLVRPVMGSLSAGVLGLLGAPASATEVLGQTPSLFNGATGILGGLGSLGSGFTEGLLGALSPVSSIQNALGLMGSMGIESTFAGMASIAGTVAPYAAAAYGLYSLFRGNQSSPAYQQYGLAGPNGLGYAANTPNLAAGGAGYYGGVVGPLADSVRSIVAALGGGVDGQTFGLYSSSSPDGKGAYLRADVVDALGRTLFAADSNASNDSLQQRIEAALPKMLLAGLQGADLPATISEYFRSIDLATSSQQTADQAVAAATAAHGMAEALRGVGGVFEQLATLSVDARTGILGLVGGLDEFVRKSQAYVGAYYSEAEQAAISARTIASALGAAGVDIGSLSSKADYRALVDQLDLAGGGGQAQFAALLNSASAFATLAEYLGTNQLTLQQLAGTAQDDPLLTLIAQQQEAQSEIDRSAAEATALMASNSTAAVEATQQSQSLLAKIYEAIDTLSQIADAGLGRTANASEAAGDRIAVAVSDLARRPVVIEMSSPEVNGGLT